MSAPRAEERGFTLMELMVASVPLAILGLVLFSTFSFTLAFAKRGETQVEAVQQARTALQLLARELRESSAVPGAIVVWSSGDGAPRDGVGFFTARADGPGRSFLTTPGGTPNWQEAVYYLHDRASRELRRLTGDPGVLILPQAWTKGRLLAAQVSRLHVEHHDDLVTIGLTVVTPSGEAVLETAVRPRN